MNSLIDLGRRFCDEEDGQDAVEYTLLLGFVVLSAAAIFPVVTSHARAIWDAISDRFSTSDK